MTKLSHDQTEHYKRDGFLFPLDIFTPEEAAAFRRELEAVEARIGADRQLLKDVRISANQVLPFVDRITRDPRVTDPVASVLGPNLLVWAANLFIKEPHTDDFISWHQDLHYWGLEESDEATIWLALSPSTPESGCVKFVAGSHKTVVSHNDTYGANNMLSRGQEIAVEVDEADATSVSLQPGQASLHHGLVFHGSHANHSDDRRIGLAIRFLPTSMRHVNGAKTAATLVRGEDTHGNFELLPAPTGTLVPEEIERMRAARARTAEITMAADAMAKGRGGM